MKSICLSSALLFASASLSAQCLFTSVATQMIGPGCNVGTTGYCKIVGLPTTTTFTLDVANCALDIRVNLFEACGVVVPFRAVAIGFQQIAVPLPDFGAGCTLHVTPDIVLSTSSGPLQLMLPPGVATLGFFAQSIALSLAPVGGQGSDGFTFSDAVAVSLQ